jgi:hypothetical protein
MEMRDSMRATVGLPVSEPTRAGEARRVASSLAERAGFDEVGRGRVALVATELANNLVLHSDGLTSHWKLDRRSPLASKHPSLVAGVLYRDFARERDDSTVVVVREGGRTSP